MMVASVRDCRITGVTAPHPSAGVSRVSEALALLSARSGVRTLLVDLSRPGEEHDGRSRWVPGEPAQPHLLQGEFSYDVLPAGPAPERAATIDTARRLRDNLTVELKHYAAIFVDLPAIRHQSSDKFDPLAAAAACDGVIVVCAKGKTTSDELKEVVESMRISGVKVAGTILNDVD
jgi:Mrp family chromosome partitioning ATPase